MNVGDRVVVTQTDEKFGWSPAMNQFMHTPTTILEIIDDEEPNWASLDIDDGLFGWPLRCLAPAENYLPDEDPINV